jgi:hemerythrin
VRDAYHALIRTVEQLFRTEQQLMEAYEFPVRRNHLEQHARVLRELHCAHADVLRGALEHGRHVGSRLLMGWLLLHEHTADTEFAIWADRCKKGLINPQCPYSNTAFTGR